MKLVKKVQVDESALPPFYTTLYIFGNFIWLHQLFCAIHTTHIFVVVKNRGWSGLMLVPVTSVLSLQHGMVMNCA